MELLILPFCVPLLLLGFVVDAVAEKRRRRDDEQRRALAQQAWRDTWFELNGRPSVETKAALPSQLPR